MLDVLIFEGSAALSPVEEMLVAVRHAALQDSVDKLVQIPEVNRIIVSTNQPALRVLENRPKVIVEQNRMAPYEFQFGRELKDLINRYQIDAVMCMGGAAVPLMTVAELQSLCRQLLTQDNIYITNNVQSADIIAFRPASVLNRFAPPATDNALALLLRYDACFKQMLLPVTLGTQYDIDTPTDLLLLAAAPFGGPHLRKVLDNLALNNQQVKRMKEILCGDYEEVALVGRIGAPVIARINQTFKVRLRVFSEERGMKALGRLDRNEVVSLLGYWIDECGPERFFFYLAKTAAAAFIDTRVIFAHQKSVLSDADRFYSDLGEADKIQDPFVREFTGAAKNCGIPVILGGHSLVAGGFFLFMEELGCQF